MNSTYFIMPKKNKLFRNHHSSYIQIMKSKCLDIETGKPIVLLNEIDARELGLMPLDRVEIYNKKTKKSVIAIVDITDSLVKENEIGLFKNVCQMISGKKEDLVDVKAVPKPESLKFIKKKLDGEKLTDREIKDIVRDISLNKISEIELSAYMSAIYIHGLDLDETVSMTKALIENGKTISFTKDKILDKHSVGGINGRATMLIVPIVAAAGYSIPKTSSRSITSAAGTADAMEVLADVKLNFDKIKKITQKVGGVICWGGAVDLAPADDKIIKVEHPLSLDPEGQVIASVMAKKAAVGTKYLVIDLPIGQDVKIKTREQARGMAKKFVEVGKRLGIKVEVVITNGTEPSGKAFGPALEAKYVLEILEGKFFDNLAQKSCELAGTLFELVGKTKNGTEYAKEILKSGKALKKMKEIIKAQGKRIDSSKEIHLAKFKQVIKSKYEGEISRIKVKELINIARISGAPFDKKAGVFLLVDEGQKIKKGQALFEIYAENKRKLELAKKHAIDIQPIELEKIILEKFS